MAASTGSEGSHASTSANRRPDKEAAADQRCRPDEYRDENSPGLSLDRCNFISSEDRSRMPSDDKIKRGGADRAIGEQEFLILARNQKRTISKPSVMADPT